MAIDGLDAHLYPGDTQQSGAKPATPRPASSTIQRMEKLGVERSSVANAEKVRTALEASADRHSLFVVFGIQCIDKEHC
jgi:hypothetical protein